MIGVSRPGAIGKPVPGHGSRSSAGTECEVAGEIGQVAVMRPDPVMFLEYWGKPDATREKFIGDWMTTGDQGIADDDGYFHFVGRDDDVITSSGYRIGPGEIEDCLIRHPGGGARGGHRQARSGAYRDREGVRGGEDGVRPRPTRSPPNCRTS